MDSHKVALVVYILGMPSAREETTANIAEEGWRKRGVRMNRVLERKRLKRGRTMILHDKLSRKMRMKEVCGNIIQLSPRKFTKTWKETTLMTL